MVEKDLAITRAVAHLARARRMRTRQILDEPERYGIPATIAKTQGKTLTSWILLESDEAAGNSRHSFTRWNDGAMLLTEAWNGKTHKLVGT